MLNDVANKFEGKIIKPLASSSRLMRVDDVRNIVDCLLSILTMLLFSTHAPSYLHSACIKNVQWACLDHHMSVAAVRMAKGLRFLAYQCLPIVQYTNVNNEKHDLSFSSPWEAASSFFSYFYVCVCSRQLNNVCCFTLFFSLVCCVLCKAEMNSNHSHMRNEFVYLWRTLCFEYWCIEFLGFRRKLCWSFCVALAKHGCRNHQLNCSQYFKFTVPKRWWDSWNIATH